MIDQVSRGQEFLDKRLALLAEDFDGRIQPYMEARNLPALRSPEDFEDALQAAFEPGVTDGATLPWGKTYGNIRFRKGETSLWPGINGHGKTLITGQVALDLVHQGERVVVASLEMSPVRLLTRLARQASGGRNPSRRFLSAFVRWLARDRRFLLLDHRGRITPKVMVAVLRYAAAEEKCTQAFVDNLGLVVAGEENYDQQKDFMVDVVACAHDTQIHAHVVHHIRKMRDESEVPSKFDAKGSGGITDYVENVFTIWRNKRKELDRQRGDPVDEGAPDALLICDKQRNGEWEGRVPLWFDPESMSYRETAAKGWRRGYDIECREPGEDAA